MKKVLITGVAAFLGSHLAQNVDGGWIVTETDNFIFADKTNPHNSANFFDIGCCDLNNMRKAMVDGDLAFQCAATAHDALSVFSPSFITKNNYEASVSTFTAAINCSVKKTVFCSSMARYGNQPTPFTDDIRPEPPQAPDNSLITWRSG